MHKPVINVIVFLVTIFVALLLVRFLYKGKVNSSAASPRDSGESNAFQGEIPDETAVAIARQSFAETPIVTNPPPIVRHENGKTVVYLPRFVSHNEKSRVFPEDWLPVWIDNGTKDVVPSPASVLSETEALEIAKAAIANITYDEGAKIKVERNSICFVFTFPEPNHGPPGTYCGPDFAAKVGVNSETGKVLFICIGG